MTTRALVLQHFTTTCVAVFLLCAFVAPVYAQEQQGMSFTVTPPLFQLGLSPGETWSSTISVVNSNPYDMVLYAEPVQFEPMDEGGRPRFTLPQTDAGLAGAPDPSTLAGWITVPTEPVTVAREQTYVLPVTIRVPEDAAPGGHYAAILIGNRQPTDSREEGAVSVSSSIAALVFLRVAGDVNEMGRIRDFATERSVYDTTQARLSLRFENQGNVHLQPQGDITIYNMFNKSRGVIPVNHANGYGNVLPGSIRKFTFVWEAEPGLWDIGRYRVEATIGYGLERRQFAQATTYFWVLPVIPLLQVVGGFAFMLWFIGWAVRAYVRRALALAGLHAPVNTSLEHLSSDNAPISPDAHVAPARQTFKVDTLVRPIQVGLVDLRRVGREPARTDSGVSESSETTVGPSAQSSFHLRAFLHQYRYFFIAIALGAVCWVAASAFFADVLETERSFRAIEERADGSEVELPTR